ncbi:hypothetical protein EPI10_007161 [Gossypium australe]|uniref:Uncharacterized protein n=1 Tax=Gossypium australe TaxID=47621 RepID=A0A5B6WWR8_9ROSI|nr:hypothetical protein EPI10_007161 [Gossypium australe]
MAMASMLGSQTLFPVSSKTPFIFGLLLHVPLTQNDNKEGEEWTKSACGMNCSDPKKSKIFHIY